jgi:hypothetical protein
VKIRYIGSDPDGVDVVCSGRVIASGVLPDAVIEVPDDVYNGHGWSDELWAAVTPAKQKSTKETD